MKWLVLLTVALWAATVWAFVVRDLVAYPLFLSAIFAVFATGVAACWPSDDQGGDL